MTSNLRLLEEKIYRCKQQYNRILLIVGEFGSGKTKLLQKLSNFYDYPYINLSLTLSEKILDIGGIERGMFELEVVIRDILNQSSSEVFVLDNVELLFNPLLKRNPLQFLRQISRNKTIIVAWPGKYENKQLSYAEPWHPEYYIEKVTDLMIHDLSNEGIK